MSARLGERWTQFLLVLTLLWLGLSLAWNPRLWRPDFAHDYAAGLLWRLGRPEAMFSHEGPLLMPLEILALLQAKGYPGTHLTRFFGHPIIALLAAPLTFFPYSLASGLWAGLQLLLWALWITLAFKKNKTLGLALSLTAFLFYPLRASLEAGQITGFVVPLTGLFVFKSRQWWAQALFALGLLLKPAAALLLFWPLVKRRWGVFLGVLAWLAALNGLTFAAVGAEPLAKYLGLVAERAGTLYLYIKQQSSLAFFYRLLERLPLRLELETAVVPVPWKVKLLYWSFAAAVSGVSLWRRKPEAILLGSLLAVPNAPTDYLALAFVPAVSLALRPREFGAWAFLLAGAGFGLLNLPQSFYISWFAQFFRLAGTLGVFLMWLGFVFPSIKGSPLGSP